jgi:hypothetical protein
MKGNWLRVSPAELARAIDDLHGAAVVVRKAVAAGDDRVSGTGQAWHAVDFLLGRRDFPVEIVWGEEAFVDEPDDDPDADFVGSEHDWGYGPPRYLTPEQVAEAAAALADLNGDDLIRGVDAAELTQAEIYPGAWDRPGELDRINQIVPSMRDFFAEAARNGDAMICWLG